MNRPLFETRIQRAQQALEAEGFTALFVPPSSDLEYLTAEPRAAPAPSPLSWPLGWLAGAWLFPHLDPTLVVPRMAAEYEWLNPLGWEMKVIDDTMEPQDALRQIVADLGLDGNRVAVGPNVRARLALELRAAAPTIEVVPHDTLLLTLRARKDDVELEILREACQITDSAFGNLVASIASGVTERELVDELTHQLTMLGATPAFPIGAWGWGPTYQRSDWGRSPKETPIVAPNVIAIDFGVFWKGYCTDFSRVVHLTQPSPEIGRIHEELVGVQEHVISALKPNGQTAEDVYRTGMERMREADLDRYFSDALGHGVGMEAHELPNLFVGDHSAIEAGHVLAVEPQIFDGDTFLGTEDDVLVQAGGGERLTHFSSEIIVVE